MNKLVAFVFLLFFLAVNQAIAQGPGPPPPIDIPIDGGLTLFLAAGAVAGAKLIRDRYQHKEDE